MNRRLPPLNALRAFEAAARHATLAAAARELCVTPSAVGHQVRSLETWLGCALFVSHGRTRRLTRAGERLASESGALLDGLDITCRALRERPVATELHVSVTPTLGIRWLGPRITRFQSRRPDLRVRIAFGLDLADFERDRADVALRFGSPPWPDMSADRLFRVDLFPVCSPALLQGRHALRAPEGLGEHTLLHTAHRRDDWRRWLQAAGVAGVDAARGREFELTTMALEVAVAGEGVAITHAVQAEAALRDGVLVAPFPRDLLEQEGCYLLVPPERREEPAIAAFREWLRRESADLTHALGQE